MVTVTKPMQEKFDTQHRITEKMWNLFPVGEEQNGVGIKMLAETINEPEGAIAVLLKVLDELEVLGRRVTYPGFQQTTSHWTLLVPYHEARDRLEAFHERQRLSPTPLIYPKQGMPKPRKPKIEAATKIESEVPRGLEEKVAVATQPATEGAELVASVGPEPSSPFEALRPLRKSESRALVEAARQYRNKANFLRTKIEELKAEGFEVDEGMFHFQRQEHLEAVALVVPYVDTLEEENARIDTWVKKVQELTRENEELQRRVRALQRTNERLVAERVNGREAVAANA